MRATAHFLATSLSIIVSTSALSAPLAFAARAKTTTKAVPGFCKVNATQSSIPISRIGFGTYRIGKDPQQARALKEALQNGINLIDTSANYGDGESEIVIGQVLRELVDSRQIKRDEVLIVSKYGYIQGQNLQRYQSGEVVTPETVDYNDYLKHCIHPDFMRDQLSRSLERLQQDRLDVFLIHNIEYYLHWKIREDTDEATKEVHRNEMQRRTLEAFKALEEEITKGRIRSYGISSNSFSLPPSDPHFFRYDNLIELATKAAEEVHGPNPVHHFSTIQLPANLLEQEGLDNAVKWAEAHGINVLVNRPINAFKDHISLRFADYPDNTAAYEAARQELISHAMDFGNERMAQVAKELDEDVHHVRNVFIWEQYAGQTVIPMIRQGLEANEVWDKKDINMAQTFVDEMEKVVRHSGSVDARQQIADLGYPVPPGKSLQEHAISFLLERSGVTGVLLGARSPSYVRDAIELSDRFPPTVSFEPSKL